MHARRHRGFSFAPLAFVALALVPLALVLAACAGGSGSSGFDAFATENAAITAALDQQRCVTRKGFTICPADESQAMVPETSPTPVPGRQPTPTTTAPRVDTGVDSTTPIDCAPLDVPAACTFTVPFAPQGFPPDAVFRVAVRQLEPLSPWRIGPQLGGVGSPLDFDAPVEVDASTASSSPTVAVQIAVLVFRSSVTAVPSEVKELADSGAEFAFVTTQLVVRPESDAEPVQPPVSGSHPDSP